MKFLSNNNKVTPAVNTGNDNSNNHDVKNIAQTYKGIFIICKPIVRILNTVTIKFIAPNKLDILVKCNANIAKSTLGPECEPKADKGG